MDAETAARAAQLEAATLRHMIRALIVSITGQPVNEAAWEKLRAECEEAARAELEA